MSNVHNIRDEDLVNKQAAIWITKLDRGLTQAELSDLQNWLKHKHHEQTFLMLASTWDKLDSLSQLSTLFHPPVQANHHRFARKAYAIAASIAACFLFLWFINGIAPLTSNQTTLVQQTASSFQATYQTAVGQHSTIDLTDGSKLTINTNSLVTVDFSAYERLITLVKGEIFIDVAHDTSRPLSVVVDDTVFQAVGTAFNVKKSFDDSIELLVTNGKVLIAELDAIKPSSTDTRGIKRAMDLHIASAQAATPGDKVLIKFSEANKQQKQNISGEDIKVSLGWLDKKLIFKGQTLLDAMEEVSRYTDSEFIIPEENLRKLKIAGVFKTDDIDMLLDTLAQNFNIHHEKTANGKILLVSK